MSLFFRGERRGMSDDLRAWGRGDVDGPLTSRGLEGALNLLPVYAAVRIISEDVATLPLQRYRRDPSGRKRLTLPPWLESPQEGMSRVDWLSQMMTSLLLRGNAYGLVTSWTGAWPSQIVWLHPDRVHVDESGPTPRYYYDGRHVETANMCHVRGMTLPGSIVGVSPISAAAMAMESGVAAERFQREWFKNKARPSAVFKNEAKTLTPDQAESISNRLASRIRAGKPLVTGSDWSYVNLQLTAEDAGFLIQAKATATQIAVMYGLQPERLGGETGSSLTYSTVEQNSLNYTTQTLRSWLVRAESAFSLFLLPPDEYVLFSIDALLRTDTKTRHEVYKIDREIGLRNIDELRELEDQPPLPNGAGEDYSPLSRATSTKESR